MTVDEYRERERQKALKQQEQYSKDYLTAQQQYMRELEKAEDQRLAAQRQNINTQMSAVPQAYRRQHEMNEMGALVNKWMGRERASNLGLANSGYARLQEASAQAQRMRKANELNRLQQSDIDALARQLQEYIADSNLRKQQRVAEINAQGALDLLNNRTSLLSNADQVATQLYNTDRQAAAAAAKLAADRAYQQAQLAQQAAQQEKAQRDNLFRLVVESAGYDPVEAYRLVYGANSIDDILRALLTPKPALQPNTPVSTLPKNTSVSSGTSSTRSGGGK